MLIKYVILSHYIVPSNKLCMHLLLYIFIFFYSKTSETFSQKNSSVYYDLSFFFKNSYIKCYESYRVIYSLGNSQEILLLIPKS